jgi:hypothetical protein
MGLPNLVALPDGPGGWEEFWFNHYQDHIDIVQQIHKISGISLTIYDIYPWLGSNKDGIFEQHQQFHNDMDQILGIPGSDLSDIDFEKPNEVKSWIYLNYEEHLNAHMALGI